MPPAFGANRFPLAGALAGVLPLGFDVPKLKPVPGVLLPPPPNRPPDCVVALPLPNVVDFCAPPAEPAANGLEAEDAGVVVDRNRVL